MRRRGPGRECPHCRRLMWHDSGSCRKCSNCGYVGWSWDQGIANVGPGAGITCPNCSNLRLHDIVTLPGGETVRRCATCNFTAIEPA